MADDPVISAPPPVDPSARPVVPPSVPPAPPKPPLKPEAEAPGEGVERPVQETEEPAETTAVPPLTPDTPPGERHQVEIEELRAQYAASMQRAASPLANGQETWSDTPQMPDQRLQPGRFRYARYETRVFDLSIAGDRAEHDRLLSESNQPTASFFVNRERQWSAESKTWFVLMDIQHLEFLVTNFHSKPPQP